MDPKAFGKYLRETRRTREITLDEVVNVLRIRRSLLEAFENGDFDNTSDSIVQIRGMLRNYARYLGLDEELILDYHAAVTDETRRNRALSLPPLPALVEQVEPNDDEFADDAEADAPDEAENGPQPRRKRKTASVRGAQKRETRRRRIRWDVLLRNFVLLSLSMLSIGVITFVVYETVFTDGSEGEEVGVVLTPNDSRPSTGTFTPSWTPRPPTMTPTTDFSVSGMISINVQVEMLQRAFLRLDADGVEEFSSVVEPGQMVSIAASNEVRLLAANAAALRIQFNDNLLESLGNRGQQIEIVFNRSGFEIISGGNVPSSTPPPSATSTPIASNTPLGPTSPPENTPRPTPTSLFGDASVVEPIAAVERIAPTVAPQVLGAVPMAMTVVTRDTNDAPASLPGIRVTLGSSGQATGSASGVPGITITLGASENEDAASADVPGITITLGASDRSEVTSSTGSGAGGPALPLRQTPANPTPTKAGG